MQSMFRQTWTAVFIALTVLYSFASVGADEPKEAGGAKEFVNSIGMKLVLIPAGEFLMGSKESAEDTAAFFNRAYGTDFLKADLFKDEHPQHRVRITRPFYLGACHVTRGQFRQFVNETEYKTDAEKGTRPGAFGWDPKKKTSRFSTDYSWRNAGFDQTEEHPVVNVSWNDAVAFCQWLSRKEDRGYRLATEAQWEYACRAGTTTRYSSGDEPETVVTVGNVPDATYKAMFPYRKATIESKDGYVFTSPVGQFKPNAFGLYDMHGNALQWCADTYDAAYYATSPVDDPNGPDSGNYHVLRGGCWELRPDSACSAARQKLVTDVRLSFTGFRVASTGLPAELGKDLPSPPSGPPFPRSSYFAVKSDGRLIVIDGRVYCWHSPEARSEPQRIWYAKLPALPDMLHAKQVRWLGGETSIASWKEGREEYSLKLYLADEGRSVFLYLAADDQGRAIAVREPKTGSLWQVNRGAHGWPESRNDPDDHISIFVFRAAPGHGHDDFLGIAEKPLTIKDQFGKDQQFFPLMLTDQKHATEFAYNDFSGK
jgi:formylglycine-generating enzyme